jgi:hypothetical protein
MTATRPSSLLMTAFVAIAAVIVIAAVSPVFHIASQVLS